MNKAFVIFNPAARGEKSQRLRHFLEATARRSPHITLAGTTGPGDARQLAARAVAEGFETIIAAGGDGTLNEAANGIGLSGIPLGILPLGTVNVFARELAIPAKIEDAWAVVERGTTRVIDLGVAESAAGRRYFLQLAGVGFDAWAVRHASWQLKKKIGPLSYIWAGIKSVRQPLAPVEVVPPSGEACRGPAVLIGNGRLYGGQFRLFPDARLDDGKLDVCVFERGGYRDILRYAVAVLRGRHCALRDVRYFQAEQFTCEATGEIPFELDGEDAGNGPVRFAVLPRAFRVVVP